MKLDPQLKGFTLLELLIVIAITAILATMIFVVFNPGDTLKKSRDSQRFADLNALHTSIAYYATTLPEKTLCTSTILYVSIASDQTNFSICALPVSFSGWGQVAKAARKEINGTGWIPINFDEISGKSPIAFLPVDPINKSGSCPDPGASPPDLYYRFACTVGDGTWELDTRLESEKYRTIEDRDGGDGGNYPERYEVGRDTDLIPADE